MRDGLNATGRKVTFYVDDGNDSSGPRVYNPFMRAFNPDLFSYKKIAYTPDGMTPKVANNE